MASADDITGKIVVCTESLEGFKEEFTSLLEDLFKGPGSHIQVFFHLLSAILTSEEESPINKFYALYLILKVSESSPNDEFIQQLKAQEKLIYEIVKAAQYDSGSKIPSDERGKTFFSPNPLTSEATIGVNYVRLCTETLMFWGDAFGSSNPNDPYHSFWLNRETLAQKSTLPHNYWFVGKDYYGQEEIATWNFAREELPSLPFRNRGQYQEGKGFVQNLNEGGAQTQVIVSSNLNSLSPDKGSMLKSSPDLKENQNSNIISQLELSSAQVKKKGVVEDTPNFQDHIRETPQGFPNFDSGPQAVGTDLSPVKENPLDKYYRKTGSGSGQDSGRKKVSFHIEEDESLNTSPKPKSQFSDSAKNKLDSPQMYTEPEPPKREKVEIKRNSDKKTTLGMKMAQMGLFTEENKSPINTKDRSPVGVNKRDIPSNKDLDAGTGTGTTQDIRNFFAEREKAEMMSKRGSIKATPIPETEFRGQPVTLPETAINAVNSGAPRHTKGASPTKGISPKSSSFRAETSQKELSPLFLVENENINNENEFLRSQLQQQQRELLERSFPNEEMSREQDLLNEEIEKYKDASQLKANRHDSLLRENTFLKSKLFEFEMKMKEMNNQINLLYNENKRLTGSLPQMEESPMSIKGFHYDKGMRASQEVLRQESRGSYQGQSPSNLMIQQQRSSTKPSQSHNLRSIPDQGRTQEDVRRSTENLGPATQAGKKKIFELVTYEKPRMVLTAKDFTN